MAKRRTIELATRIIPYAMCPKEQCLADSDCALVRGHVGPCYLTSWLFDENERKRLENARRGVVLNTNTETIECIHDTEGTEECIQVHYLNNIRTPQCKRCKKCGLFIPAHIMKIISELFHQRPAPLPNVVIATTELVSDTKQNEKGWTYAAWLTAAGLYHLQMTDKENAERYLAWERGDNPYRYDPKKDG